MIPGSINNALISGAEGGYSISRSLRFNSSDSAYFSRTPASAGDRRKWTWAGWLKFNNNSGNQYIFGASPDSYSSDFTFAYLRSDGTIKWDDVVGGSAVQINKITNQVFRDFSAWYHLVFVVDTTNGTAANRNRLYVNGAEVTWASGNNFNLNNETSINRAAPHHIGGLALSSTYTNAYLADIHFIDGQALDPTSFGEFSATTGVWMPKQYTGSYGTNGFKLNFSDNSTAAALGTDSSGAGNTWTVNNISVIQGNGNYLKGTITGNPFSSSYTWSNAFDGSLAGFGAQSDGGLTYKLTFSSALTGTNFYIYTDQSGSNTNNAFGFNNVTATTSNTTQQAGSGPYYKYKLDGISSLSSVTTASVANFLGVEIDGVLLVDNSFSAGNDSLVDVPVNGAQTDTGVGGEVRGNYCTWNPLNAKLGTGSVSNGNLDFVGPSGDAAYNYIGATFGIDTSTSTGWYYEVTQTTYGQFAGVALLDQAVSASSLNTSYIIGHPSGNSTAGITYTNNGAIANYGAALSTGNTSWTSNGDVIGIAIKDNKIWFAKNGTWISGSPSAGTSPSITLASTKYVTPALVGINSAFLVLNAGARSFAYTAPSGFKALNTASLPSPLVTKPNTVMDIVTRSGFGTSGGTVSSLNFEPDLIWSKGRNGGSTGHFLLDSVRGISKTLSSNNTDSEATYSTWFTSTTSTGYTIGAGDWITTQTVVEWCWDAGSSTVTDNTGSIQSTRRTNASAGFSIVSYTGSGAQATVGHGLGVSPGFIVAKSRTATGGYGWAVYHSSLGKDAFLNLNAASASTSFSNYWGTATPNSTVFGVGNGSFDNNTGSMIAYCFAPVNNFSAFGSYTGNGSTDGPFVYTGFRPKFVLIKGSSFVSNWNLVDGVRDSYNVADKILRPNLSNAELNSISSGSGFAADFLSNGFKLRASLADSNSNAETFVWAAFAESPFQYARAR